MDTIEGEQPNCQCMNTIKEGDAGDAAPVEDDANKVKGNISSLTSLSGPQWVTTSCFLLFNIIFEIIHVILE
jgi:hypothetical protein